MNRHILQRKDPRVQMTQPETSESKTALDILTENVRKSETVEIVQTLTIDPNSSLNSQA
jgi:hypothetical protein